MDFLFDMMYSIVFVGGFALIICLFDGFLNLLYELSPKFRRHLDDYLESFPEWEDEE